MDETHHGEIAAAMDEVEALTRRNPARACRARPLLSEQERMRILMASDDSSDESFDEEAGEGSDDEEDEEGEGLCSETETDDMDSSD